MPKNFVITIMSDIVATNQSWVTGKYQVNIQDFLTRFVPDRSKRFRVKVLQFRASNQAAVNFATVCLNMGGFTQVNSWTIEDDATAATNSPSELLMILNGGQQETTTNTNTSSGTVGTNRVFEMVNYTDPFIEGFFSGSTLSFYATNTNLNTAGTTVLGECDFCITLQFSECD